MEEADEEVLVVEQQPLLAGQVELRELEAEFVVHVLSKAKGDREDGGELSGGLFTVSTEESSV